MEVKKFPQTLTEARRIAERKKMNKETNFLFIFSLFKSV